MKKELAGTSSLLYSLGGKEITCLFNDTYNIQNGCV